MIREIIAGLIIAVWTGDEEVQASNNSSWFTNNLAPHKSKYRDLRLNCNGRWPRVIYIRNPLVVLNVYLSGMQAPWLFRDVLLWTPLNVVCLSYASERHSVKGHGHSG